MRKLDKLKIRQIENQINGKLDKLKIINYSTLLNSFLKIRKKGTRK